MTVQEFKHWRWLMRFKQREAAEALGVTKNAVARWEMGDQPIRRVVALACAAIRANLDEQDALRPDLDPRAHQ